MLWEGIKNTSDKGFVEEILSNPDCKEIFNCIQCGVCTGACPISAYVTCVPRKIIAMTREGLKSQALETLDKCLLCGQCQMFCPAGIQIKEVLLKLRDVQFAHGKTPKGLMMVNGLVIDMHNPYMETHETRKKWIESTDLKEFASKRKANIAYFVGCTASYKGADGVCQSVAGILTKLNQDWTLLDDEWCCGITFRYVGNVDKAREYAEHNIKEIEKKGVDVVIAGCPTCWHNLKHRYPKLLGKENPFKVMHIYEYVLDQLNNGKIQIPKKMTERVTYHDPCDLSRYSMTHYPREIIGRIAENFVEMPLHGKDSQCCGAGGLFDALDPALRSAHSTRRVRQAEATGAQTLITSCAGCRFYLRGAAKNAGSKLVVKDLMELLYAYV